MSSEIITTKRDTEIGRLLERVIRDHRKDISAYSKGHLNENNLYKPPEAGRVSWKSAKLPAIKLKKALTLDKESRDKKMWEAVACFSAGSAFKTDLPAKQEEVERLNISQDNINLEEFDASYFILPKAGGYQVVPSLYGCLTKRDELLQRKVVDSTIVEKQNLTDQGWYNGSRATKNIKLSPAASDIQVYAKLWEDITKSCTLYNPLLVEIKQFYNGYLQFLKENQTLSSETTDDSELQKKKCEIESLTSKIGLLEEKAMKLVQTNAALKEEHEVAECVLSDIKMTEGEFAISQSEATSSIDSHTVTVGANIEQLRREILHKRADMQTLHKYQRQVMVPMEVYQCMVQCVQSAEIELQKQNKSIEVLQKKQSKYTDQLSAAFERLELTPEQSQLLLGLLKQEQ